MPTFSHDRLPLHLVPRIKTRVLVSPERGADNTTVWEQWIESGGYIPLHYHEVEEILVFVKGEVALTVDGQTVAVHAPATTIVPPRVIHGMRHSASAEVHLLAIFPTAAPTIIAPDGTRRPMPWADVAGGEVPP